MPDFYLVYGGSFFEPERADTLEEAAEIALDFAEQYRKEAEIIACESIFWLQPNPRPDG